MATTVPINGHLATKWAFRFRLWIASLHSALQQLCRLSCVPVQHTKYWEGKLLPGFGQDLMGKQARNPDFMLSAVIALVHAVLNRPQKFERPITDPGNLFISSWQAPLYASLRGLKSVLSQGCSQCDVWAGSSTISIWFSIALEINSIKL